MNDILEKILDSYQADLPFVAYRKPNSTKLSAFFMKTNQLIYTDSFTECGFVFSPFQATEKSILFAKENSFFLTQNLNLAEEELNTTETKQISSGKETHIELVKKTIETITTNAKIRKIVVSRKELVSLKDFNLVTTFKNLLKKYQNAFVYVWFHPKVGLWLGATPETLLNIEGKCFETMSLAGTQVYQEEAQVVWGKKELEEQQLVTDFIEHQLLPITSSLKIEKTKTVKAGSLLHLKTKVEGEIKETTSLENLVRALHPTPAVCGLPRNNARDFILNNEGYDRNFYTGFLGELNIENQKSSLFVNLRCMRISNKTAHVYVGGGITKDSNPEKEWLETASKANTMKSVL